MELDLPEPRYHWEGREDHLEEGKEELTTIYAHASHGKGLKISRTTGKTGGCYAWRRHSAVWREWGDTRWSHHARRRESAGAWRERRTCWCTWRTDDKLRCG